MRTLPKADDRVARFRRRWPGLASVALDLDALAHGVSGDDAPEAPVFVCGLARAGTTFLTEFLASSPQAASHRYSDRPYPHAAGLWRRIDRALHKGSGKAPRAHGDGIWVDRDSPESADEALWREFTGSRDEFAKAYRRHLAVIAKCEGRGRYAGKNNEHVGRVRRLFELFPDARVVFAVRPPGAHVASLMRQHERFCDRGDAATVAEHMRLMGHEEFGAGRQPPSCLDKATRESVRAAWADGLEAQGWAEAWRGVNEIVAALASEDSRCAVARQDALDRDPARELRKVADHARLPDARVADFSDRLKERRPDASLGSRDRDAVEATCDRTWRKILALENA